jgi:hypothetical protein
VVRNSRIRKGTRKITTKAQFQNEADTQANAEAQVNAPATVNAEAMEKTWDRDSHNSFRMLILANQL